MNLIKGVRYLSENNSIKYGKLIRDRIPEIIESKGKKAVIEVLDDDNFKKYLDNKLGEELKEYLDSGNIEELADMVEVIYALIESKGISIENFERTRIKKAYERGGFSKKLLLKEVFKAEILKDKG